MPRKKIKKEKISVKPEAQKVDAVGWRGGVDIDLDRILKASNTDLRTELSGKVGTWLEQAIQNQEPLIKKLQKWQRQYKGLKKEKSFPYTGCANLAIPITRSRTDAVHVRVFEAVWGQMKVWIVRATKKEFVDIAPKLEDALDWWQRNIAKLREKLHSPLLQCIKTGTGIVKLTWRRKPRTVFRYGANKKILKNVITEYDGPDVQPVSREDFVISSEATSIDDAFLVGHRVFLREEQLKTKAAQGIYYSDAVEKLKIPDDYDDTKKERAKAEGKEIPDSQKEPFEIWELWFQYDVEEDGVPDDIVVSFHPATRTILRAIYNPYFMGFRPFIDFVFFRQEYSFDGEGVCEILEKPQEEIDSMHNQRIDRINQINAPKILVREGSGIEDFELTPGGVEVVDFDLDTVMREVKFSDVTYSNIAEENMLVQYCDYAVGSSPEVMGMSTAERPVAREALARLQEVNKKFQYGIKNIFAKIGVMGMKTLELFAQYQPTLNYEVRAENRWEQESLDFPLDYLRDGIKVEVMASGDLLNQTERREINLTIYQLLSDASTKLAGVLKTIESPLISNEFRKYLMKWVVITERLVERILRDFNQVDAEDLIAHIEEVNVQQAVQESGQIMKQMQSAMQAGQQGQQPAQIAQGATK